MDDLTASIPSSAWPSTSFRSFFLYDTNHPSSIAASVIDANSDSQTYLVTCSSSCASSVFPEQTITHISDSSWAGERTVDGTTTSWGCNLGTGSEDILSDQLGWCSVATGVGSESGGEPEETAVNSCFVLARSVAAFITGGMDRLYEFQAYAPYTIASDEVKSEYLSSLGCLTATTVKAEPTTGAMPSSRGSGATSTTATSTSTANQAPKTNTSVRLSSSLAVLLGPALLGVWAGI